jgi:hypothetical protein
MAILGHPVTEDIQTRASKSREMTKIASMFQMYNVNCNVNRMRQRADALLEQVRLLTMILPG